MITLGDWHFDNTTTSKRALLVRQDTAPWHTVF